MDTGIEADNAAADSEEYTDEANVFPWCWEDVEHTECKECLGKA